LINIDHCSDGALLIYYNKDETEFLAPKLKLISCIIKPKVNFIIPI